MHFEYAHSLSLPLYYLAHTHGLPHHRDSSTFCHSQGCSSACMPCTAMLSKAQLLTGSGIVSSCCSSSKRTAFRCRTQQTVVMQENDQHLHCTMRNYISIPTGSDLTMSLLTFFSQSFGIFGRNEPGLPLYIGHSRHIPWVVVLHACQCLQLLLKLITLSQHLLQQHRPIMT